MTTTLQTLLPERHKKENNVVYYAFLLAVILHAFLFYAGSYYGNRSTKKLLQSLENIHKAASKPLDFTFVDIPEKNVNIQKLNPDALASDRNRISAQPKPEHYDPRASKLPEMKGNSANLVIPSTSAPTPGRAVPVPLEKPGDAKNADSQADTNPESAEAGEGLAKPATGSGSPKKLSESLKNLDKYITPREFRNNPASSYEPEIPSDSDLWLDTQGVDFGPWARQVHIRVRNNWIVPMAARFGFKGKVVVDFEVLKNGTVQNLIITGQSGIMSFDQAALNALALSNPLPELPAIYPKPVLIGRFSFYYNMNIDEK